MFGLVAGASLINCIEAYNCIDVHFQRMQMQILALRLRRVHISYKYNPRQGVKVPSILNYRVKMVSDSRAHVIRQLKTQPSFQIQYCNVM